MSHKRQIQIHILQLNEQGRGDGQSVITHLMKSLTLQSVTICGCVQHNSPQRHLIGLRPKETPTNNGHKNQLSLPKQLTITYQELGF